MLTVSICVGVAALVSLGAVKAAADSRVKASLVPVRAKRRNLRIPAMLAAIAVAAAGTALAYTVA